MQQWCFYYFNLAATAAEKNREPQIPAPNIDSLAQTGIRFTNAYATAAMCTPSRYSLMTGQYAFRHPNSGILSAEDPGETTNLANENPEKAAELARMLKQIKGEDMGKD